MKKERLHEHGDVIYVLVPPRTVRRYFVRRDGSMLENNQEPKPPPTIATPVQVELPEARTQKPVRIQDDPAYQQMYQWATGLRRPGD